MPGPRSGKRTRATPGPPPDGQAASARNAAPVAGDRGAPKPQETRSGTGRRRAERGASGRPEVPFHDLLRGLRAGDLEGVLLTVAMAADENRMPSADPDEVGRILAFLARLAEHDAALPPPDGAGSGPRQAWDGIDAECVAPAP